jgi:hypothetical protein
MAPVKWPNSCVTVTAHVANPPANLTPDLAASAARAAAAVWSRGTLSCPGPASDAGPPPGPSFELKIALADDSDAPVANDNQNNLVFRKSGWDYEPSALAITTVFAQQANGVILDADVELNAVTGGRFKWGDLVAGVGAEGAEDLQNTLTHEFGHLLGLDHNCFLTGNTRRGIDNNGNAVPECERSSAEVQDATMFAAVSRGDILRRTLASDDIAGVCAVYPPDGTTGCTNNGSDGLGSRGCSFGGVNDASGAAGGLLLAAVVALSARRRRGRRRG